MPINTDLNIAPYFDDFNLENQFYKVLYKPAYAVQARELTQMQTMLQNQLEQFGDNIYQEGSIIKGCTFTQLNDLQFVKLQNAGDWDPTAYIPAQVTEVIGGVDTILDIRYEAEGETSGLKAAIVTASVGFETRPPDLNTFYINYTNTTTTQKTFNQGESITINRYKYNGKDLIEYTPNVSQINVTRFSNATGSSFGISTSDGIIFQKGHFLFTKSQVVIVSKYNKTPDGQAVGYEVAELLVTALSDASLYDNANGSSNENAPGADRLKLTPTLVVKTTADADVNEDFFSLIRYENGEAVQLRDTTQFNSITEELAKRTYEESGDYVVDKFDVKTDRRGGEIAALVGPGKAYVKGYRVENGGTRTLIVEQLTETETEQNQSTSFTYDGYMQTLTQDGTFDLDYAARVNLQQTGGTTIGTAYVYNIEPGKIYLSNVQMSAGEDFSDVTIIEGAGGRGEATVTAGSGIVENNSYLIFKTGNNSTKTVTDMALPVRRQTVIPSITSNSFTIDSSTDGFVTAHDYNCINNDMIFVDANDNQFEIDSFSTANNADELTINLATGGAVTPGTLYHNARIILATPHAKQIVKPYIKFGWASGITKVNLGFPDVLEVLSVTGTDNVDYKNSFKLHSNQKNRFYDLSYMSFIKGRPTPPIGTLTIQLRVFKINTSTGQAFFTVNSYPIDDVTEILGDGNCRSWEIPAFKTKDNSFNLRDSIDFRPYVRLAGAADYSATTPGAAAIITEQVGTNTPIYESADHLVPANQESAVLDIEYYLPRYDSITVDSFGAFSITQGTPAVTPAPPVVGGDQLVIGVVEVPAFPGLSQKEAVALNKLGSAITVRPTENRNYTMNDISRIDQRLTAVEEYVSLSQLETDAENYLVLDENGLNRFKNGWMVDAFNDLKVANIENEDYSASIDFMKKALAPALRTFPIDLVLAQGASVNASIFPNTTDPEIGTLSRDANAVLLNQPFASNFRNCVSNYWSYNGVGALLPDHDMVHDTVSNPISINVDLEAITDDIQAFFPVTSTSRTSVSRSGRTTTTRTDTTTTGAIRDGSTSHAQVVGDFVTNVDFLPYMRSRNVSIFMAGLRPNTQHWFFFDEVDVNNYVWPGQGETNNGQGISKFGARGAAVSTDDKGVLRAVFRIPTETFFVGDRKMLVVDVDTFDDVESASTSRGSLTYHGYNINLAQTSATASTRIPSFTKGVLSTRSRFTSVTAPRRDNPPDPLAQTFFIKGGMGRGSNSVFISKIDLFFKRKSDVNGVTVMLREVTNGYPGNEVLPFSQIHVPSSAINVSDDASAVTTIDFEAPVRMDIEKEYSVVILPDANDPNFLIFTSKVGGTDLTPGTTQGQAVIQDWGDGVLFTSTNNKAWKSYQDEDLKFKLYRHSFNEVTGTVALTNDHHEFFTLSAWDGAFEIGEIVYETMALAGSTEATISATRGSDVLTGTAFTDTYEAGNTILIADSGTNSDVYTAVTVTATEITLDRPVSFTAANNGTATPVISGKVTYHHPLNLNVLHVKQSSASSTKPFTTGGSLVGLTSETTGTIGSIDNINLSYVQPMIAKSNDSVTETSLKGTFTSSVDENDTYNKKLTFGANNNFTNKGVVLYSKSNNFISPKTFTIEVDMANRNNITSTPTVDIKTSSLIGYQHEVTNVADTTSKYISKTTELAANLDAEDLNVILTGYRPSGTNIKVYIKPQNSLDSSNFDNIDWIELEVYEGKELFSSNTNLSDWKEFKYKVAAANKTTGVDPVLTYTTNSGTFTKFRKFAIRIDLMSDVMHRVPTVKDYRALALT
jgi:hypothetical protein